MQLDSVRALKLEIHEKVVSPLTTAAIHSFGVAARSLESVPTRGAPLALGVAAGTKKGDYKLAVRIQRRTIESDAALHDKIASTAKGETDIRYIGRVSKQQAAPWQQGRVRPLLIGTSVGHFAITAGTIGAFATLGNTGRRLILSNNHVLANEGRAKTGDAIFQQGQIDGGRKAKATVALLSKWIALQPTGNLVDAAVAELVDNIKHDPAKITGLGKLSGLRKDDLLPGLAVSKLGRTTGLTHGKVTAIEVDNVMVAYETGDLSFDRTIEIEGDGDEAFSLGGDSGSLIVDTNMNACALLFAGSDQGGSNGKGVTYANDIATVLQQLGVSLDLAVPAA